MVGKTFIVAAAGVAAVNAQCTFPYAAQLPGNSIFTPDGSNTPTIGVPFSVTYDGTGLSSNLRFLLLRGPGNNLVELGPIADVTNCGTARCSFQWTPAANLEPDTSRYGLRLLDLATCNYQYTTQFGLNAGAARSSVSVAAPSSASAPAASLSVLPPRPSGSVAPPAPSGSAPPRPSGSPAPPADDCDEQPGKPAPSAGGSGGYSPPTGGYYPSNGTGYTNGTGGVSPTYRPIQSNDGARMAISAFGAIVAFSAAVMAL